ncbi:MAG: glycosyltransferase family 4 protein [Candidatus Sigynarchaeota archaeon]
MLQKNKIKDEIANLGSLVLSNPWFGVGGLERVYLAITSATKDASIVVAKNFHDLQSFPFYFGAHKPFPSIFDIDLFVGGESPHVHLVMNAALERYFALHPGHVSAHVTNHWGMFFPPVAMVEKSIVYFQPGVWEMENVLKIPELLRLYKDTLQERIVLANSAFMKALLKEQFGCDARVLYPCTDTLFFADARDSRKKEHDVMVFSRLNAGKQFSAALDLFKDVARQRPGSKFLVAGAIRREDMTFLDELKAIARKEGIERAITFVPNPSLLDLKNLYAATRLLVFFPKNEPLGLVPVEAMVSGVPVVAFDSGGVKETVIPGKTGVLCKDEVEMAEVIGNLLADEKKLEGMRGNTGLVVEKFSEETFLRNFLAEIKR